MLRYLSIRGRLMIMSVLLVAALIGSNLVLINQTRLQADLIEQQKQNIDLVVRAGTPHAHPVRGIRDQHGEFRGYRAGRGRDRCVADR